MSPIPQTSMRRDLTNLTSSLPPPTRPARHRLSQMSAPHRVAVIGAGVSGLCAARHLQASALPVSITVFEKSRSLGGRLATKTNFPPAPLDHGAPFFALSASARDFLSPLLPAGALRELPADAVRDAQGRPAPGASPRFYCAGGNAAVGAALAQGLDATRATVTAVTRAGVVRATPHGAAAPAEHGPFDLVIVAVPLPQAAALLSAPPPVAARWAASFSPTLTALLTYDLRLVPDASPLHRAAAGRGPPFAIRAGDVCAACDSYKRPAADGIAVLVAHAGDAYSADHLEKDGDAWLPAVRERAEAAWAIPPRARVTSFAKRWRYARVREAWKGCEEACPWMGEKVLLTGDGVCGESQVGSVLEQGLRTGRIAEGILRGCKEGSSKSIATDQSSL